jgi:hypothetical protein
MKVFKIKQSDLPLILMSNNEEGFLRYNGEIVEFQLSQWILRYSLPGFDELTLATTKGLFIIPHILHVIVNYFLRFR